MGDHFAFRGRVGRLQSCIYDGGSTTILAGFQELAASLGGPSDRRFCREAGPVVGDSAEPLTP